MTISPELINGTAFAVIGVLLMRLLQQLDANTKKTDDILNRVTKVEGTVNSFTVDILQARETRTNLKILEKFVYSAKKNGRGNGSCLAKDD